jgi:hypothetical protein
MVPILSYLNLFHEVTLYFFNTYFIVIFLDFAHTLPKMSLQFKLAAILLRISQI